MSAAIVLPAQNVFGQTVDGGQALPIPPESTNDALNYLRREHFEPFVNTIFEFQPDEGRAFTLKLVEVEKLSRSANEKQGLIGESFSLLFEGSKKMKIAQGTYHLNHDSFGKFSLFIAPVGLRGNRYEAIINRINA